MLTLHPEWENCERVPFGQGKPSPEPRHHEQDRLGIIAEYELRAFGAGTLLVLDGRCLAPLRNRLFLKVTLTHCQGFKSIIVIRPSIASGRIRRPSRWGIPIPTPGMTTVRNGRPSIARDDDLAEAQTSGSRFLKRFLNLGPQHAARRDIDLGTPIGARNNILGQLLWMDQDGLLINSKELRDLKPKKLSEAEWQERRASRGEPRRPAAALNSNAC
jgi:hypothetical protein